MSNQGAKKNRGFVCHTTCFYVKVISEPESANNNRVTVSVFETSELVQWRLLGRMLCLGSLGNACTFILMTICGRIHRRPMRWGAPTWGGFHPLFSEVPDLVADLLQNFLASPLSRREDRDNQNRDK